jgi:hypothetical protein
MPKVISHRLIEVKVAPAGSASAALLSTYRRRRLHDFSLSFLAHLAAAIQVPALSWLQVFGNRWLDFLAVPSILDQFQRRQGVRSESHAPDIRLATSLWPRQRRDRRRQGI